MYAIIRTGGKQTKVRPGDVIDVELLKTDDENVTFTPLLVVDDSGATISDRTVLAKATVSAKVLGEGKGDKIDIFKYKNKTGYSRRLGHRQRYTSLEVTDIALPKGAAKAAPKKAAPKKAAAKKAAAAEPAPAAAEEE
jgi:large subunit ribosomal protein L21